MMMKGFEWYRTWEPAGPDRMSRAGVIGCGPVRAWFGRSGEISRLLKHFKGASHFSPPV